jgi:hypothetical protein
MEEARQQYLATQSDVVTPEQDTTITLTKAKRLRSVAEIWRYPSINGRRGNSAAVLTSRGLVETRMRWSTGRRTGSPPCERGRRRCQLSRAIRYRPSSNPRLTCGSPRQWPTSTPIRCPRTLSAASVRNLTLTTTAPTGLLFEFPGNLGRRNNTTEWPPPPARPRVPSSTTAAYT